jgi:DNA repair ATPase RecN
MTDEQVERAIETLLNNQANFEVQLEKTNQQVERTSRQLAETNQRLETYAERVEAYAEHVESYAARIDGYAETQTEFMRVVIRHIEAQGEINASLRDSLARTDKRLDALIDIVMEGRNGKS